MRSQLHALALGGVDDGFGRRRREIDPCVVELEVARRGVHVLVPAAGEADRDDRVGAELLSDPHRAGLTQIVIAGGLLVQDRDNGAIAREDLKVVTRRQPTEQELADCLFAWTVAKHVKSNAIVYARDGVTVGIGAGQMNRRDSSRIAAMKAEEAAETHGWGKSRAIGSAVASDAFFPFADGLLAAAEAGATVVIQPGGSIRDEEVIAAADAAGLAMVFTNMRHFRH